MKKRRYMDLAGMAAVLAAILLVLTFLPEEWRKLPAQGEVFDYTEYLFDPERVHSLDIRMKDWNAFLGEAEKEEYQPCEVEIDGEIFSQVGIRCKGNNSRRLTSEYGLSRYSLKLEFDNFQKKRTYHGLDKFSLDASFQDNSYMKTWLAYDMMKFMEVPSPLCSYVWVTVNGKEWGLFLAVEEPEDGFARRNFGEEHGKLYKPDYRSLKAENRDVALQYIDDSPESYPNIFDHAKFPTAREDQRRLIRALQRLHTGEELERAVDTDEVLRYFTVQVFVMNWDSYLGRTGHNYFLYEKDGRLSMIPWDYNLAFGTYALGMTDPIKDPSVLINYPINTPADGNVMKNRPLYHNLMKVPEYFSAYHACFSRFLSDYFESGVFEERYCRMAEQIAPFVEQDPTAFCSYEDHLLAVDTLKEVCRLRAESIRGQLNGEFPITLRERQEHPERRLDVSHICLEDLGDFEDLKSREE